MKKKCMTRNGKFEMLFLFYHFYEAFFVYEFLNIYLSIDSLCLKGDWWREVGGQFARACRTTR